MKKFQRIAVASVLASSIAFGVMAPSISVAAAESDVKSGYLAIGDCMTRNNAVDYALLYPAKVGEALGEEVTVMGESDMTIGDLKDKLNPVTGDEEYKSAVQNSAYISINIGYNDFTTTLMENISAAVSHTTGNIHANSSWQTMLFSTVRDVMIAGWDMSTADAIYLAEDISEAYVATYSQYIKDYRDCVNYILNVNPKANVVLMGLNNPIKDLKVAYTSEIDNQEYTIDLGKGADILIENANSYIASMIVSINAKNIYEKLRRYDLSFIDTNRLEGYTSVADKFNEELPEVVRARFDEDINGLILKQVGLREVSYGLRAAYDEYVTTGEGWIVDDMDPENVQPFGYSDLMTMMIYNAIVKVVANAASSSTFDLTGVSYVTDIQKNVDLSQLVAIISDISDIVFANDKNLDRVEYIESCTAKIEEAVSVEGLLPLYQYLGRYIWAGNMGNYPSDDAHAILSNEIVNAFTAATEEGIFSDYTAGHFFVNKANDIYQVLVSSEFNPVQALINNIEADIAAAKVMLKETVGGMKTGIQNSIAALEARIAEIKETYVKPVVDITNTVVKGAVDAVITYQLNVVKEIVNTIKAGAQVVANAASAVKNSIDNTVEAIYKAIDKALGGAVSAVTNVVTGTVEAISNIVENTVDAIVSAVVGAIEWQINMVTSIVEDIITNIVEGATLVAQIAVSGPKALASYIKAANEKFAANVKAVAENIKATVSNINSNIKATIANINENLAATVENINAAIKVTFVDPVLTTANDILENIAYVLNETVFRIVRIIDHVKGSVGLSAEEFIASVDEAYSQVVPTTESILAVQDYIASEIAIDGSVAEISVANMNYEAIAIFALMIVALGSVMVVSFKKSK